MIAKKKKPHNIGETLIKPYMLKESGLVLGKTHSKNMAKIFTHRIYGQNTH